jgi:hypothetical protein
VHPMALLSAFPPGCVMVILWLSFLSSEIAFHFTIYTRNPSHASVDLPCTLCGISCADLDTNHHLPSTLPRFHAIYSVFCTLHSALSKSG